jgi:atypical dual specificity phosphatase
MPTWWIDEPGVVGSGNPTDADLGPLRAFGFSVIVCLLDLDEQTPRYDTRRAAEAGWEWHNIPIRDCSAPSTAQLREFVVLLATSLPERKVVVHCQFGSGRTGTMAAAHWISQGLSAADAISRVRQHLPDAIEMPEQEAVLVHFADSLGSADRPSC